jgi:predicted kinase
MAYPKLVVMTGLPRAGKSSFAAGLQKQGFVHLSSDALREALFGHAWDADERKEHVVFSALRAAKIRALQEGFDVVIDSTAYSHHHRQWLLDTTCGNYSLLAEKYLVWIKAEEETLRARAQAAGRSLDGFVTYFSLWENPLSGPGYQLIVGNGETPEGLQAAHQELMHRVDSPPGPA